MDVFLTGDVLIMAELPELIILAGQMDGELQSKEFHKGELRQEKSLNLQVDEFIQKISGKNVFKVYNKGKWIFIQHPAI